MELADRVAVVTGAGSGIGRALAVELGRAGCRLALLDRDADGLAGTVQALGAGPVLTRAVDVSDADEVRAAADAVVAEHGRVDLVVNNAGIAHGGTPFWELPEADFARVLDVNFWGVVHGTRAFLPHLVARPEAALVNLSSVFGIAGVAGQSAYCASKFAVRGFTESVRMDLRAHAPHVRAVVVHPGGIATAIARNSLAAGRSPEEQRAQAAAFDTTMARTTAASAAATIVRGIRRGRERILIGTDARLIDTVVRALPARYTDVLRRVAGRSEVPATPTPVR